MIGIINWIFPYPWNFSQQLIYDNNDKPNVTITDRDQSLQDMLFSHVQSDSNASVLPEVCFDDVIQKEEGFKIELFSSENEISQKHSTHGAVTWILYGSIQSRSLIISMALFSYNLYSSILRWYWLTTTRLSRLKVQWQKVFISVIERPIKVNVWIFNQNNIYQRWMMVTPFLP